MTYSLAVPLPKSKSIQKEFSSDKNLLTWDYFANSQVDLTGLECFSSNYLDLIKNRSNSFIFTIGKLCCFLKQNDPAIKQFMDSNWSEVVDIIANQSASNYLLKNEFNQSPQLLSPFNLNIAKLKRKYSQQPCSVMTVNKRVEQAKSLCSFDDPILLLGDDDLISIKLADEGFTNITALDIDDELIDILKQVSDSKNLKINYHIHDLNNKAPDFLKKDYKLIFIDPFYTLEGASLFLNSALGFTTSIENSYIFMNIHVLSLYQKGLIQFQNLLNQLNLKIDKIYNSFNNYPAPISTQRLINISNKFITRFDFMKKEDLSITHFFSDALILVSNNTKLK